MNPNINTPDLRTAFTCAFQFLPTEVHFTPIMVLFSFTLTQSADLATASTTEFNTSRVGHPVDKTTHVAAFVTQ